MQQDFQYVYQVYKNGSFSKAAQELYMTQPALSISIKKIEDSIGMPLFDRSRHPLALTQAGKIYIDTIEKVQNLDREMLQQLKDIQQMNSGHICLGGSHYLNAYILPKILADFNLQYPNIEFELVEQSAASLALMLANHELDLTFSCNEEFMKGFERYPVFNDYVLLAVNENHTINQSLDNYVLSLADIKDGKHLMDTCPAITLQPFKDMEFILLSSGNNLHERSIQMFKASGYEPKIKMQISQLVTAYHLAEYLPVATFVSDRLAVGCHAKLKYYKLAYSNSKRLFYALLPKQNYTPIATKTFIDFFIKHINSNIVM